METVHDTDAVFEALEPMGLRAVVGKCMMDADAAVPARLLEQTRALDRRERGDGQALARPRQRTPARRVRAAVRRVVLARAARSRGAAGASNISSSSTRTRPRIATRSR